MPSQLYKTLQDEIGKRSWSKGQTAITRLVHLYEGELPQEFDQYFPTAEPRHVVNLTRLAWDDLATAVGTPPELRAEPRNNSDAEMKRTGLLEKIGYGYAQTAEPASRLFYWQLAWWLIGTGRAVVVVKPDFEHQRPVMSLRDPRSAYPSAKKTVGRSIVEMEDIIFKYDIPGAVAHSMGLAGSPAISRFLPGSSTYGSTSEEDRHKVGVIEMIDDKRWLLVSEGGTVMTGEHRLGRVPAHMFQTFSVEKPWGLSQFEDQISLQVAISRLLSLKLAYTERLTYPVYWAKGHQGEMEIGPLVINKLEQGGEMGQLTPPTTLQADRDIDMLASLSRVLNRNPEVRQGEVDSKGAYVSAKTLEQLSQAIDNTVSKAWDVVAAGKKYLYSVCFQMDETLWPDVEKPIGGSTLKGKKYQTGTYVPSKDIKGRWDINVDYGFGLGGYAGFLQRTQAVAAGLMPKREAIESMPGVSDVDSVIRAIELERVDDAAGTLILALASSGTLDLRLLAKMRKQMAEQGKPLAEVALEIQDEMERQAQASLAATGGLESALTVPEGAGAPQQAPMRGMPPIPALAG